MARLPYAAHGAVGCAAPGGNAMRILLYKIAIQLNNVPGGKMKVCIHTYTGFGSLNGGNLRIYHLARELMKKNDVTFIVPSATDADNCRKRFGAQALDVGMDIGRFNKSRLKLYPRFAWKASRKAGKDNDVVFGQSLPSALAVRLTKTSGLKVIDYVDLWSEYWLYAHPTLKGKAVYRAVRKAESYSMKADTVFTITEKLKGMMVERGCDRERIKVVRDGVDTGMFAPRKVCDDFFGKYGLEKGVQYVTYQGGIAAHDGVQFLVDAAPLVLKENPDVKFLIVGAGDYFDELKKKVETSPAKDSFIFTGWVPYEDMPSFMNISRINAVPLPDSPATQGVVTLKLFEAMACGTPTIIGDLPGPREHVTHLKSAYLMRSEDKEALSSGINRLLSDRKLYKRIRSGGLEMVPDYDWKKIASEMADGIFAK